jgi:hypothetical protein
VPISLDPKTISPASGHMLCELIDRTGGKTKGGLWKPEREEAARFDRDAVKVRVLRMGPPPRLCHPKAHTVDAANRRQEPCANPWPEGYAGFDVGSVLMIPRDVPLVIDHDGKRFVLAKMDEAILVLADADVDVDTTRS